MTITDVQSCVLGRDEKHSGGSIWTFVRIYTDDGIVGTGECDSAGVDYSGFATKEAVLALRPHLIGQDPANSAPIHEDLRRRGRYSGANQAPSTFALTGIENALFDILDKKHGLPIYALLGGACRKNIRLYADCNSGERDEPESFAEKAHEAIEDGFSA